MATRAATGANTEADSFRAGRLAALHALESCPQPDVALVFATGEHDHAELLGGVGQVLGETPLVGCSAEGVIGSHGSDESEFATATLLIASDSMRFETSLVRGYACDPTAAGRELAAQVQAGGTDDLVGLLVFPDGLQGNCTEFLDALQADLPVPSPTLAGGTSGDSWRFEETRQFQGAEAVSGAVAALVVRGRGSMHVAVSHGCTPIGLERTVTREAGGWVHEIDGLPAWEVFREYLEGEPDELTAEGIVQLCVGLLLTGEIEEGYPPYIIRTPLKLDRGSGALYFPGGGIGTGQTIQLTRRDPTLIPSSAGACARDLVARAGSSSPACVFQFDCAGRGRILFGSRAARRVVRPLQEELDAHTPWLGFHTYGEIAPLGGHYRYHNYSVSLCALYEDDGVQS